jgi:uncharacterized protein
MSPTWINSSISTHFVLTFREDLKYAMRTRDTRTLNPLKALLSSYQASVKQYQLKNSSPDEKHIISNLFLTPIIHDEIRKREESIDQFKSNHREDLAESEIHEVEVLKQYLVQPQTTAEYVEEVTEKALGDMWKTGVGSNDPGSMSHKRIYSFLDLDEERKEALGPLLCDQKMKRRVVAEVVKAMSDRIDNNAERELELIKEQNKPKREDKLAAFLNSQVKEVN